MDRFCALSSLRSMRVLDRNGEFVGRIGDVLLDVRDGRIEYVCIHLDSTVCASPSEAIVPWSTLSMTHSTNARWRVSAGKAVLMDIAQPASAAEHL